MGLQRIDHWPRVSSDGQSADWVAVESCDGEYYRAADVDALLAKLSGLTCKAEGWEADEDIIVVHGVGIVGSTLSRRNSGAVARWFNGAMAEIMERLMKGGV